VFLVSWLVDVSIVTLKKIVALNIIYSSGVAMLVEVVQTAFLSLDLSFIII